MRTQFLALSVLKATHLQRIAQATGIKCSGPKAALVSRLHTELPQCEFLSEGKQRKYGGELSVLSIDMGIRNLAFAHLTVGGSKGNGKAKDGTSELGSIRLNAWRRLAVSSLSPSSQPSITNSDSTESAKEENEDVFSPTIYARNAYTLIKTLLATYNPTHILIERQRFRSGGGSAVLEWTLRVGVFEGMVYAVLETLMRERLLTQGVGERGPVVYAVEPSRVVRYWDGKEGKEGGKEEEEGKKKRATYKEGKKVKIDLVGRWLATDQNGEASRISLGTDAELQRLVDAYLLKWQGKRIKKAEGEKTEKLDDLADCLLQGVTWVEWQVMRQRICNEGVDVLE